MTTGAKPRRILMVHFDGAGNQTPLRALTRELVGRGHEVHVLTHNSVAGGVSTDGGIFHPLVTAHQYKSSDHLAADDEVPFFLAEVFGSRAYSADFLAVADRVRPDIFLIDCLLVSVLSAAIDLPTPCVALNHVLYAPDSWWAPLFDPILGGMAGTAKQLTYRGLLEGLPLVLVFAYPKFSSRESFAPCVEHVGPIREPVEPAEWPRRYPDRPFILVSLSTSFMPNQSAILQRICDALARLPVEALVTLGPNVAAEEISVAGGVEVRTFVPHDQVLSSVDLLITHAGLGTVMAGTGAGVPMLCMPMGREQPFNASRVQELGLGRVLHSDAAPDEIGQSVEDLLRDKSLNEASRVFAAGVKRFGDLERAADLIEKVADTSAAPLFDRRRS